MSLCRQLTRGLFVLAHRGTADQEVADEVQHYLEQATAAHVAAGLAPDAARRAAGLEIGNATIVRERVRAYGWENAIGTLLADLRYAARRLRGNPGLTAVAAATLALGIGASTAIFSAVNPVLFEPLPYPHPGRVTSIAYVSGDGRHVDQAFGTYAELAARGRSFDALAVMKPWQPTMTGPAQPERFDGQRVSASYFHVLGVLPTLGRGFDAADDRPGGPDVVVLDNALWQRRFGGDSAIIGRPIRLDDDLYTVIGVMPSGFENVLSPSAEVWSLLQYDASLPPGGREWGHHLRMVGRLRRDVTTDEAGRELGAIARAPTPEFSRPPWASMERGFFVSSLQTDLTAGVEPALLAVLGAVMMLLTIACVNVTNLLLAHGAQRRGEFAMRAALGAARSRLIRQLLTESLLLAVLGGALGILVAELGVRALVALSPAGLPRVSAIRLDGAVFAFALGVTTLIGLVVGLAPALHASRSDLYTGLQHGSRRTAGSHQGIRRALVVAEVALALVLLVSAGLLLRSLERLFAISPGFDASHLITMQVQTSGRRFDDDDATHRFFTEALDAVRRVPGVTAAAFTSQLPLTGDLDQYGVAFENDIRVDDDRSAYRYAVTPGYFETLGIPLRRGRLLDARDMAGAPVAVLINESFAKRKFPDRSPIGQRVHVGSTELPWYTIVGVVGDVKQASLAVSPSDAVYIATPQWPFADRALSLVVRARGDEAALAPAIRNAIWSVDKDQPIVRVATMDALLARSAADRRFALVVFETFALAALVLAATGIYGVLSGSVTERLREMGIRSALGASRTEVVTLVVRQGMLLTAFGVAIGLTGAVAASRAILALLFGVSQLDPVTYLAVIALLAGVSAIACAVPAWRAARVDASITLRAE